MAASGYTPIQLYYSATTTNVPLAANLAAGELAINTADGKLFYKDSSGTVQTLASKATAVIGGSNTQVQYNSSGSFAGSANFVWDNTNARLGIGTSSPATQLHLFTAAQATARLASTSYSMDILVQESTNTAALRTNTATPIVFLTNSTEKMRLDSSGNLGLNVTPSTWTGGKAIQINDAAFASLNGNDTEIMTNAYYNTGFKYYGTNLASRYVQTTGKHVWSSAPSGTAGNTVTFTDTMVLDASGNLGIGTSSPSYKLTVNQASASTATAIYYTGSTGGGAEIKVTNGYSSTSPVYAFWFNNGTGLGNPSANVISFINNAVETVRISAAGGFSVGTTADPGAGAIYATGNITAYYSSDARLKENIKDVDNALDIVCAIGSKTFDWTDEYIASKGGEDGYFVQKSDFGVVAQDVQEVFPQAVRTREDGTLAVDYEKLATLSFGAIKSLLARVEALEAK